MQNHLSFLLGTTQSMNIRAATEADISDIQELAARTWRACYKGMISKDQIDYMLDTMYHTKVLKTQMSGSHRYFLYQENNQLWGFISLEIQQSTNICHIHKLYVAPEQQKKQIGRQLIEWGKRLGQEHHCEEIALYVNRNNRAIYFYQKMGLKIISPHDLDIGGGYFMNDFYMKGSIEKVDKICQTEKKK